MSFSSLDKLILGIFTETIKQNINEPKTSKSLLNPIEKSTPSNLRDWNLKEDEHHKKKKQYKHESECRRILNELYYPHKFDSIRPNWLSSPLTGKNLELDGYNAELKIAFEYQGKQHYEYVSKFHKSEIDLQYQQEKDNYKASICKERGIILIIIPYMVKSFNLRAYIYKELQINGM